MKNNKSNENRFQIENNKWIEFCGEEYKVGDLLNTARQVLASDGSLEQEALAGTIVAMGRICRIETVAKQRKEKPKSNNVMYCDFK